MGHVQISSHKKQRTYGVRFAELFLDDIFWLRVFDELQFNKVNFYFAMFDKHAMLNNLNEEKEEKNNIFKKSIQFNNLTVS
jgi:hypothetical protein